MTADSTILIEIKSDGTGAKVIKRDLDEIAKKSDGAKKSALDFGFAIKSLAGYLSVRAFSQFADNITTIDTRLKNVTGTVDGANKAFDALFKNAQTNGSDIAGVVQTYSSLANVLSDSLKQSTDLVKVTDLLSRGFAASGATANTAAGATLQLTQGLATNFQAAGQELNSIIEGAPILAKAIAESLGGETAADLKKFAQEGRLTSEIFLKALIDSEEAIKAFKIPDTISASIQRISNEFVRVGRESEVLKGISGGLSSALNGIANNMDGILKVASVLTITTLPLLAGYFLSKLPIALAATSSAFASLTAVMMANPFIAIATVVAAAVSAIYIFRKEIAETLEGVTIFGVDVLQIFKDIGAGAPIVFSAMATIIGGTFMGLVAVVKKAMAEIDALQFRAIDKIANTPLGKKLGINIDDYALSSEQLGMVGKEWGQVFNDAFKGVENTVNKGIFGDFAKKTDKIGLTNTGAGKATPPKETPLVKALDEANKSTKEITDSVDKLSNKLEDDLSDAFKSAFTNSDGGFKKLLEGWKAAFKNFIAEIAYQALARPVIMSIVGGVSGSSSASASSISSLAGGGSSGGIGGLSSLSNLGSLFSGGLSTPIFSAGSAIGSGINSIGASLGLNNSSFIGPMLPGTSSLASAFTPAAGLAGFGGGMLANVLGLGGGIGGSIGGAAGGIAGTAIGANMGTILGFAGGPAGAAIGAFLGTALGGLFGGGKPSDKSQGSILNLETLTSKNYGQTGDKFSQENRDFATKVTDSAKSIATALTSAGATLKGGVDILVGSRDGLRIGGANGKNYGTNSTAFINAVAQSVLKNVSDAPEDLKQLINKIAGKDVQSIADALDIYSLVKSFESAGEAVKPLEVALKALDEQFKALNDKALSLGLSTDKMTESYEKQRASLIQNVLSPLQDFLDNQALSGSSSLNPAQRLSLARSEFDTNLSSIQGGDLANIDAITSQASTLLSIGRDIFASGEAFAALESYVRQSISGIAGDLGAPNGLNDSVAREISLGNAQQISIQSQMLIELQETRAENTKLRKTLERLTNQVVIQA